MATYKVALHSGPDLTVQADFPRLRDQVIEFCTGTEQSPVDVVAIVPIANLLSVERTKP
jgi:hypothetical protein